MRRSVGLGLLFTLAGPLVLAAQGVPAAPAALKVDSLAQAANAAAAANTVAINFVWTLIAGFLVMFMQAGFAMVETGFTRAKNAAHTFAMNFMVYGIGMLAYWAIGFALQAGGLGSMSTLGGFDKLSNEFALHLGGKTWGLFGHTGFFLSGVAYAAPVLTYFLFQVVFMDTAAAIPIPGHNIPMALVGTFMLCFGWFGFNPGSTLAGSDLRIGVIATNTMLAGAAGSVSAMLYIWRKYGKPDPSMMANGALAGLVAITAPCAFVTAPSAVLIGAVAGYLVCAAVFFIERALKIDDPVGAISVHGVCGLWGILSVGLLADGTYGEGWNGVNGAVRGLFYGDPSQFVAQCIGGLTNFVAVGAMAVAAYKLTEVLVGGHRVSAEVEELGLDLPEMGALAYPDTPEVASAVILSETAAASHGAGQLEPEPEPA